MELAVDISNFTRWPLTVGDVQCWVSNNVSRVMVQAVQGGGRFPPGHTAEQLALCAQAPVRSDGYILPFDGDSTANLRGKRSLTTGYRIGQWWFDLEEPMSLDYVRFVLAEMDTWPADEGPTGLYTAPWYMRNQGWMGITEFSDRKLWVMQQKLQEPFVPFCGWTDYALRQYALDASLCGITGIDISVINPSQEDYVYVGDDYWSKFGPDGNNTLADRNDWPGVAANLEGIISQVMTSTGSDAECEAKLAQIQGILKGA